MTPCLSGTKDVKQRIKRAPKTNAGATTPVGVGIDRASSHACVAGQSDDVNISRSDVWQSPQLELILLFAVAAALTQWNSLELF